MKRPAFQWYPGDAQRDTALRSCCLEARGLWREMMDLMHDGAPYGHLTAGGVPIPDKKLYELVGINPRRCIALLAELEQRRVFSRTTDGVIYSRRMVSDEAKRNARASGGWKSLENPNVPRPKDGRKDTFDPSLPESNRVSPAVGSLQSAYSQKELVVGKRLNGTSVGALEAGELVQSIRRLADRHIPSGNQVIQRQRVGTLGADVLRAYEAVGGSARFLAADAKALPFLNREFGQALEQARVSMRAASDVSHATDARDSRQCAEDLESVARPQPGAAE